MSLFYITVGIDHFIRPRWYLQIVPPILPFRLEQITQELGNAFVALAELRNMLSSAQKDNNIDDMPIDAIKEKIDKINELILDIPEDLAKIGI